MLFNSIEFAIFLPVVFLLYWFVVNKNLKWQNFLLLAASYVFYGWWDWRFLSLIVISSVVDYFVGLGLGKYQKKSTRKLLLIASLSVNLGFLVFFKYFNFFLESFVTAFTFFGQPFSADRLNIVLPVGISFYTFQTLSYSIDVYKGKLKPTRDIIAFFAFVSFFPQLVAGPIERASNLLPQFAGFRRFNYGVSVDGLRQILWGFFKKIVIADNCAVLVNDIFSNYDTLNGSTLVLGAFLFAFQIYGDFSGYSDIAIGTARLFGFRLMRNFAFPYFSRDIAEFWRRWHISLSTWFRDYLYIPLGGSRGGTGMKIRNTFIIFVVSGFWHGANWTFIIWGALNAIYFLPLMLLKQNRKNLDLPAQGKLVPGLRESGSILLTFAVTLLAWIFFRSPSVGVAFDYIGNIFSTSLFTIPQNLPVRELFFIAILISVEWLQRSREHGLEFTTIAMPKVMKWGIYIGLIFMILTFGGTQQDFIYFQF